VGSASCRAAASGATYDFNGVWLWRLLMARALGSCQNFAIAVLQLAATALLMLPVLAVITAYQPDTIVYFAIETKLATWAGDAQYVSGAIAVDQLGRRKVLRSVLNFMAPRFVRTLSYVNRVRCTVHCYSHWVQGWSSSAGSTRLVVLVVLHS
jgi:hypothetical protein